jgi:hypothetical protein
MATDQVQNWIQNEVKLSKVKINLHTLQLITSFESDFANGYLFGEILNQYNFISDISTFTKKYAVFLVNRY